MPTPLKTCLFTSRLLLAGNHSVIANPIAIAWTALIRQNQAAVPQAKPSIFSQTTQFELNLPGLISFMVESAQYITECDKFDLFDIIDRKPRWRQPSVHTAKHSGDTFRLPPWISTCHKTELSLFSTLYKLARLLVTKDDAATFLQTICTQDPLTRLTLTLLRNW